VAEENRHTILHADMDAFYAAIEQRDHPEWRGRPVVVGAPPDRRGVVATASYEARRFGIRSAMPSRTAGRLCPQAIFVPPRMDHYVAVSREVMAILEAFTPLVEPLSLDEAFLDVRGALRLWGDAVTLARELKRRIRDRLALTASIGVATNKFLAKVASDLNKPDGLTVVPADPEAILAFLAPLPVTRIWGVGRVTEQRFGRAGLRTIGQIQRLGEPALAEWLGKTGAHHVWELAHGRDDRPVETGGEEKSISNETTFETDVRDGDRLRQTLLELVEEVGGRLRKAAKKARSGRIKLRFGDFRTITRQESLAEAVDADRELIRLALRLFDRSWTGRPLRLVGFGVSGLVPRAAGGTQMTLALPGDRPHDRRRDAALDRAVDRLRARFGIRAVRRGGAPGEREAGLV
jgi:nucleotidyltransferase/DNA polymerase involved in DNA repair